MDKTKEEVMAFLKELSELSRKHNIYAGGMYDSPILIDYEEDPGYYEVDYKFQELNWHTGAADVRILEEPRRDVDPFIYKPKEKPYEMVTFPTVTTNEDFSEFKYVD